MSTRWDIVSFTAKGQDGLWAVVVTAMCALECELSGIESYGSVAQGIPTLSVVNLLMLALKPRTGHPCLGRWKAVLGHERMKTIVGS